MAACAVCPEVCSSAVSVAERSCCLSGSKLLFTHHSCVHQHENGPVFTRIDMCLTMLAGCAYPNTCPPAGVPEEEETLLLQPQGRLQQREKQKPRHNAPQTCGCSGVATCKPTERTETKRTCMGENIFLRSTPKTPTDAPESRPEIRITRRAYYLNPTKIWSRLVTSKHDGFLLRAMRRKQRP